MKINEAINWILNRGTHKGPYSLDKIKYLLEELGNPQNDYACMLVGGTNGKGSVTAITQEILLNCEDYVIGSYTSPHLIDIKERIKVGGKEVSDALWIKGVNAIKEVCNVMDKESSIGAPAFFEVMTALSFWIFRELEIDAAIIEVGLGGRFDSTNACSPEVSVITNIGTDHKEILGETKLDIAKEKLGIIRKNRTLITAETDPEIISIFEENVKKINGKLIVKHCNEGYETIKSNEYCHEIKLPFNEENTVFNMPGEHQLTNLSLALELIEQMRKNGFAIPNEAITEGIKNVKWSGRLQWIGHNSKILLDGAHNIEGIETLNNYLEKNKTITPLNIIFGCLKDKPLEEMTSKIEPYGNKLYFVSPNSPRAYTKDEYNLTKASHKWLWQSNLEESVKLCEQDKEHKILICGSLYLVAQALELLEKNV